MDLSGNTVTVTGVASGIGKGTAAELRRRGATVIGVDRNPAPHVDEFFEADLGEPDSIERLIAELPDRADGMIFSLQGFAGTRPRSLPTWRPRPPA